MSKYRKRPQSKSSSQDPILDRIKVIIIRMIYFGLISSIGVFGYLYYLSQNLPSLEEMINPIYDLPTQIYDRDNNLVKEFYTQRRVLVRFDQVPDVVIKATMAIEDNRFYDHFGIDPLRILKALWVDIITGSIAQGGSTLTQQTAKNFLLSRDKKIIRKIKEILLALKIESQFTKNQILELYLNEINYGHGAYGIEAAAQGYFGKNVEELTLPEAALLAGIPQAPSRLAPTANIKRATRKRNLVLTKMHDFGYITAAEMLRAQMSPIELKLNQQIDYNETSYYAEHVRRYIYQKYGQAQLYRGGMKVYTAMDLNKQIYAQNALHRGLIAHDRRQGYRGPKKNILKEVDEELGLDLYSDDDGWDSEEYKSLDQEIRSTAQSMFNEKIATETIKNRFIIGGTVLGVVTEVKRNRAVVNLGNDFQGNLLVNAMKWARPVDFKHKRDWTNTLKDFNEILKMGDVIELEIQDYDNYNDEFILALTQKPTANGAVFVMDPHTGRVLAISGGFDYRDSEFNRAIQANRQTGSIFKAIVYSLALESSFTPASLLDDSPFVGEGEEKYKPENYSKSYSGKMSLRTALVKSKNIPATLLTKELGTEAVIEHARKLGITGYLPEGELGIVLGQSDLTLEQMTRTFSIFANGGKLIEPVYITKIEDRDGEILEEHTEVVSEQVLDKETSFLMTNILEDVVVRGTGWRAKAINRPSAGKTGSTDNYADAWYMGYTPQLITGVYVGFDIKKPLGDEETGSKAALPIWVDFMKNATATMRILPFSQPDGIKWVRIVTESGLLDCNTGGKTRYEYFRSGTEPTQCHRNSPNAPDQSNTLTETDGVEQPSEEPIEEL